jgi:hypothetical protein
MYRIAPVVDGIRGKPAFRVDRAKSDRLAKQLIEGGAVDAVEVDIRDVYPIVPHGWELGDWHLIERWEWIDDLNGSWVERTIANELAGRQAGKQER